MKSIKSILKIAGAVMAVIGTVLVVVGFLDEICAGVKKLAACRAQGRRERLASVTGQCLRAGLLFAGFTAGLLYALAEPLTAILYQSEQAGRLLRVFAPLALVLYLDALTDGMLKGLSEQVANVRYNTLTSALDAVLLVLLSLIHI